MHGVPEVPDVESGNISVMEVVSPLGALVLLALVELFELVENGLEVSNAVLVEVPSPFLKKAFAGTLSVELIVDVDSVFSDDPSLSVELIVDVDSVFSDDPFKMSPFCKSSVDSVLILVLDVAGGVKISDTE